MSKAAFDRIAAGLDDALAYAQGDAARARRVAPRPVDVKAIRQRLGLSQAEFAGRFGFPLKTLCKWEQGERRPSGAARVLLLVIDREPEAVRRALAA